MPAVEISSCRPDVVESVWFWQRIVSPHMMELAKALSARGAAVTYVAERTISADRAAQGWQAPDPGTVGLRLAPHASDITRLVGEAPAHSIHICQGFRGNGIVDQARNELAKRNLRQWVIMETVKDRGWRGALKRLEYRRLVHAWRGRIEGVLAIGDRTPAWLAARGMPADRIHSFANFLRGPEQRRSTFFEPEAPFRFLFVGQLVERKGLDLLIKALRTIADADIELVVIGSGPLDGPLRALAQSSLGDRVSWIGRRPQQEIPALMQDADCLVLPSRFDGWGAVISEALLAGTPAICSDGCGAAGVVRASGRGGVFRTGDKAALGTLVRRAVAGGRQTPAQRSVLARWAQCLHAEAGATYLQELLFASTRSNKVAPPWASSPGLAERDCR